MTNEQAIIELRDLISDDRTDRENEALLLAIEKFRDKRPTGEWLKLSNMSKRSYQRLCSNCNHISYFCGTGNYPFCPYCKAEMKSEEV